MSYNFANTDASVRCIVALDPSTHTDVLTSLSQDEHSGVRWHVARNPSTPQGALINLIWDPYWSVRYRVARHLNISYGIWIHELGRVLP